MDEGQTRDIRKPTVNDIARVAGVSLATVDRVLNGRPGVRLVTVEKVNNAIVELGYVRDTAAANLARKRVYRLIFILPDTDNEFMAAISRDVDEQSAPMAQERTTVRKVLVPPFDPQAIVDVLDVLGPDEADGVAVIGPETISVRDAVNRLRGRGIAVAALVSDLPSSERDHFVGIDNVAAGRTAAQLLGRFTQGQGRILVITGSPLARDHLERRSGFDEVLAEDFPNLSVVASLEGRDDPALIHRLLPDVFRAHPEVTGIYSSAAGNPGLIEFLNKSEDHEGLAVVAHELTESSRAALSSGVFDALISQNTGHLVRSATRLLKATADKRPFDQTQEHIRIDIYMRENLPPPRS